VHLVNAQTAGIDYGQGHAIDRIFNKLHDGPHFIPRQNHRQFLAPRWPDYVEDIQFSFQGGFIKELDAAQIYVN
jgi:hypothetical protein